MKFLKGLAVLWLVLSFWLIIQPKEPATPPPLPWMEIKATLSFTGQWLAFAVDPEAEGVFGRHPEARTELLIVDRQAGETTRIQSPKLSLRSPRLSGRGDKIVFEGAPGPDYLSDIYLAPTDGSKAPDALASPWRNNFPCLPFYLFAFSKR